MFRFVLFATLAALGRASYLTSNEAADEGIVGGDDTTIEQHPYQLAVLINNQIHCGASLLKPNLVLTAAHCTYGAAPNRFQVRAGSTYYAQGGVLANVVNKREHPKYQGEITRWDYDVAVLVLDKSLPSSGSIQTISLQPVGAEVPDGTTATVAGWGKVIHEGPVSSTLKKVLLPKVSQQQCANSYPSVITDRMTCYGYPQGGKSTCQCDSGGPLVVNGRQIGIVSWAAECAAPGKPTVFAKISNPELARYIQGSMAMF